MLGSAPLLTVLDSLAKAAQIFAAAVGVDTSVANTVAQGAANNVTTIDVSASPSPLSRKPATAIAPRMNANGRR